MIDAAIGKRMGSKTLFGHSILAKIVICFTNKLIYTFFQALLGILLIIVVVWHLPPRIVIKTGPLVPTVPWCRKGAWWFNACNSSNLNGLYLPGKTISEGMVW